MIFYLRTVRRCCHNTTSKYLMNSKKIVRIALAKGWMKKDPFAQVHFHFEPVETGISRETGVENHAQQGDLYSPIGAGPRHLLFLLSDRFTAGENGRPVIEQTSENPERGAPLFQNRRA